MTREEFLKNKWRPYPLPPPDILAAQGDWRCGRLLQVGAGLLRLDSTDVIETSGSAAYSEDPQLGSAIPFELLQHGDSVAVRLHGARAGAAFLLSPSLQPPPAVASRDWQLFLEVVRDFFKERGFLHCKTPHLVTAPGVDAHIDFMTVEGVRTQRSYCLPTSPEFELKKIIAHGERKVFEIKSCFRDDDDTGVHRPEFTMLEWYRAYENKWSLVRDFEGLLAFVGERMQISLPSQPALQSSIAELFQQRVGFVLQPDTTVSDLRECLQRLKLDFAANDDWDDLFFRVYIQHIEPYLGKHGPEVVYNFPATQGSIARTNEEGWADRFEIYWRGIELANAYQEQNNPELVESKVNSEIKKRKYLNRKTAQADTDFLQAMRSGFPPCAGIALGLDRLYMVLMNQTKLE